MPKYKPRDWDNTPTNAEWLVMLGIPGVAAACTVFVWILWKLGQL